MIRCTACRQSFPSVAALYAHLLASATRAPDWDTKGRQTIAARIVRRKRAKRPVSNADQWIPDDPAIFEPLGCEEVA